LAGGWNCGGSYEIDDNEDVETVTVFRNEFESFNTARKQNSPIYRALKEAVGFDVEGISSLTIWETMLNKMWISKELPNIFMCKGPDSPDFYKKLIDGDDIIAIDDWVTSRII